MSYFQYVLYKPKKTKDGLAANFKVSPSFKDGVETWNTFLSLAKQKPSSGENDAFDWQDDKGKNKNVISLGIPDIGALLSLFSGKVNEIKLYHEYMKEGKKVVTSISATPYSSKNKQEVLVPRGYSVNITRGDVKFGFGISFAEAEILSVLLKQAVLSQLKVSPKK